jgi:hypothetical protein
VLKKRLDKSTMLLQNVVRGEDDADVGAGFLERKR